MLDIEALSDEEIVERVRSVDRELYAAIMERYQEKLSRYAVNLIKDKHKAADVIQESFIKAFINLNSFDTKKKFSSWLYRIVHNEAINIVKKYRKEIGLAESIDFESRENIEKDIEQKELLAEVKKCLERMPLLYAEPLILYYIEEKTYEEISDILRLPMGTVATRISRAKIIMKNICQKN